MINIFCFGAEGTGNFLVNLIWTHKVNKVNFSMVSGLFIGLIYSYNTIRKKSVSKSNVQQIKGEGQTTKKERLIHMYSKIKAGVFYNV